MVKRNPPLADPVKCGGAAEGKPPFEMGGYDLPLSLLKEDTAYEYQCIVAVLLVV